MRTLGDIQLNTLQVRSDDSIADALLAMQKAGVAAASVIDGSQLRGIVTIEAAILSDSASKVIDVMRGSSLKFQASLPVRSAAKLFVQQQADCITVYDGDRFLGLLSSLMLITELGRSWDPLTGLSWSDRLRDWGVESLDAGQEIGIIFFDLNGFGNYNKEFGHTVGDTVLKEFAELLGQIIDPATDVLVRYGGDEFAIGTTRTREQIDQLLGPIQSKIFSAKGIKSPVTFSFGISGGKRTHEPSRDHVAATLDNLINLASQACIAAKPYGHQKSSDMAVSVAQDKKVVTVVVEEGEKVGTGSVEVSSSVMKAVAEATASAMSQIQDQGQVTIEDAYYVNEAGLPKVYVVADRQMHNVRTELRASADLNGSMEESVAQATLRAIDIRSAKN